MARPIRLEFPGANYHVTTVAMRMGIFLSTIRIASNFDSAGRGGVPRGLDSACLCADGNHYHLLIEVPNSNLSRGMRQLNGVYTQRFNSRHGSGGRVFQGRFKAVLVERDGFLLELCRYIVLSPLRLKAVKNISRYRWSSFRATAGEVEAPAWLCTEWVLGHFGRSSCCAQRKYAEFVEAGIGLPSPLDKVKSQICWVVPHSSKK